MLNTILPGDAKQLMNKSLLAAGLNIGDADIISSGLIRSSLNGIDTHGIRLFETYLKELHSGRANRQPNIRIERETPVTALLDADNANGVVAGVRAMDHAIAKAADFGLAFVLIRNSNHFGAASIYTRQAADHKLIGMCLSNADALVALEHGREGFLGTNPIAFSAPGSGSDGFNLDFATSQIAFSKVMDFLATGKKILPGWAIDDGGQDSSTSQSVKALKPLGGYKGQGLGFMVQMLTSVLSGMPFDHQLSHLYREPFDTPRQISHCVLAIDPGVFMDTDQFCRRVDELLSEAQKYSPESTVPGTQERAIRCAREKDGIPLYGTESIFFSKLAQAQ